MKNCLVFSVILAFCICFAAGNTIQTVRNGEEQRYDMFKDERLSPALRIELDHIEKIMYSCDNADVPRIFLWKCLLPNTADAAEKTINTKDSSPLPLLFDLGDTLCQDREAAMKCFKDYLTTLSGVCLKNDTTILNVARLQPLEIILEKTCDGSVMNAHAQNMIKCGKQNYEKYVKCFGDHTKVQLQDVDPFVGHLAVIPYFSKYSCRQIDMTEKCLHEIIQDCNMLDEINYVTELFSELRRTPNCENVAAVSAHSFTERFYQTIDLLYCIHHPQIGLGVIDYHSMCTNVHKEDVFKDFRTHIRAGNISIPLRKHCRLLPEVNNCLDEIIERVSPCLLNDYEHFNKKGLLPLYRLLEHFCEHEPNSAELIKPENLACFEQQNSPRKPNCFEVFGAKYNELNPTLLAQTLYIDYELHDVLAELKTCIPRDYATCDSKFVEQMQATVQVLIDEVNNHQISYY